MSVERLTMWYDGNHAVCKNEDCEMDCCPFADPVCDEVQKVIDRLSEIEDILGDDYDLDRLKELVEAKRDGRCIILPQKTVFELTWDAGPGCDMNCPTPVDGEDGCDYCDHGKVFIYERQCKQEHLGKIGTTVFLSREAAEAALKGERDG